MNDNKKCIFEYVGDIGGWGMIGCACCACCMSDSTQKGYNPASIKIFLAHNREYIGVENEKIPKNLLTFS